jgi:hypothetical protein
MSCRSVEKGVVRFLECTIASTRLWCFSRRQVVGCLMGDVGAVMDCSNEGRGSCSVIPCCLGPPELCEAESGLVLKQLAAFNLVSPPAGRVGPCSPPQLPPLVAWEELQHPTEKIPSHLSGVYLGGGAAWTSTEEESNHTACRNQPTTPNSKL